MDNIEEHDVWLNPHDMDHLRDGAPVFKPAGESIALVLRAVDWEAIENLGDRASEAATEAEKRLTCGGCGGTEYHIRFTFEGDVTAACAECGRPTRALDDAVGR